MTMRVMIIMNIASYTNLGGCPYLMKIESNQSVMRVFFKSSYTLFQLCLG